MNIENLNIEKNLNIIYMGTPDFSANILENLIKKYKVRAIISQPDKKIGRHGEVRNTPVKNVGVNNTILVLQPSKIKEAVEEIKEFNPDLIITCAYGQIVPTEILEIPRLGCINVHASLLPKLRGGAPIHRAIIEGHSKTGITIMYMAPKMDAGDIITQKEIEIMDTDTAESLHDKLSILGSELLLETLPSIINGTNKRIPQDESLVTYGYNISREDELIDFNKTTREVLNKIRGLNSWPGAYTKFNGKILKIWEAITGNNTDQRIIPGTITSIYDNGIGVKTNNGEIIITLLQLEGKKRTTGIDFSNGRKDLVEKRLS